MSDVSEPNVILVDELDQPMGHEKKQKAHELGLCHRAFSVFILKNPDDLHILMQQRAATKYHCGGLWTNTCCSHPAPGQDTEAAAQARLTVEMGLHTPLTYAGVFHYVAPFDNGLTENEVDHVYYGWHDPEDQIIPNPDEVDDHQWMSLNDLKHRIQHQPHTITPWLSQALTLVEQQLAQRSYCAD